MIAVYESKTSIVNKNNNLFHRQTKPYIEFWRPLSFIFLTILLRLIKNIPIRKRWWNLYFNDKFN